MKTKINKHKINSEITKKKLLDGVESTIRNKGIDKLKITSVSEEAQVDKKLIYFHFGGFNELLEEFLQSKDFWLSNTKEAPTSMNKETVSNILTDLLNNLLQDNLLRELLKWELTDDNEILKKIAREREINGNKMIKSFIEENKFKDDVKPLLALLIAGIYYLSIHSQINGSTFCGIDINNEDDKNRLAQKIASIIHAIN